MRGGSKASAECANAKKSPHYLPTKNAKDKIVSE